MSNNPDNHNDSSSYQDMQASAAATTTSPSNADDLPKKSAAATAEAAKNAKSTEPAPAQTSEQAESNETVSPITAAQLQELKQQQQQALQTQKLQHLAELQNQRKLWEREKQKTADYAIQKFAEDLMHIVDAFEQGIANSDEKQKQGLELTFNIFNKTLANHGITPITPKEGDTYDHNLHEAMITQAHPDLADNQIIAAIQTGYRLKERLLRPARVIVVKN